MQKAKYSHLCNALASNLMPTALSSHWPMFRNSELPAGDRMTAIPDRRPVEFGSDFGSNYSDLSLMRAHRGRGARDGSGVNINRQELACNRWNNPMVCKYEMYRSIGQRITIKSLRYEPRSIANSFPQKCGIDSSSTLQPPLLASCDGHRKTPKRRNGLLIGEEIIGTFGIERRSLEATELRRMYLAAAFRGRGIAQRMLGLAEERARELQFDTMVLSTAEVQRAALRFYRKSGYQLTRIDTAEAMSTKTVGGGLTRYHFERTIEPSGTTLI